MVAPFAPFTDGGDPQSALVQGSDGNFYGVTEEGGGAEPNSVSGYGEVYKITAAGVITPLHLFTGADGVYPMCALVEGSDGYYYGTTSGGGANGTGTVFSISSDGSVFNAYSFAALTEGSNYSYTNTYGAGPYAGLVAGSGNIFYGTTTAGGVNGYGTIFSVTSAGVFNLLHSFTGTDGRVAESTLVSGPGGYYGTTGSGGLNQNGTTFMVTTGGAFTSLHSFAAQTAENVNADGIGPGALVLGANGLFYGTTSSGGSGGGGTDFTMTTAGSINTLHNLAGNDGRGPSGLVEYGTGNFYGTTQTGGINGGGTVYRLSPAGSFLTLYSFSGDSGVSKVPSAPHAALVKGNSGYLYGTTTQGGAGTAIGGVGGTVFSVTTGAALKVLHYFIRSNSNGATPVGGLLRGQNGLLYGGTEQGGSEAAGAVFAVNTSAGTINAVYSAFGPDYGLVQISDSNLYGTTGTGGTSGQGLVFRLGTNGEESTLHSFNGKDGSDPSDRLIQGANGDLYGTTLSGTIFQLTLNATLTTLYQFPNSTVGEYPDCLLIGKDTNFYGTTSLGGTGTDTDSPNGNGTVFELTNTGTLNPLHSFSASTDQDINSDGISPVGIIQATDGNFYGVTGDGGTSRDGTVFEVTSAGKFRLLHTFNSAQGDGASPVANLIQAKDGNFYVPTTYGGANNGYGAIMQVTPAGLATTLYSFTGSTDGQYPEGSLIESATAGTFYGTASEGGENGTGTVFAITVSPAITSATTGSATEQQAYSYQVIATNTPTAFTEGGLPAGLGINGKTGLISGTPTASGTFTVNLTATNAGGTGKAVLKLTVAN